MIVSLCDEKLLNFNLIVKFLLHLLFLCEFNSLMFSAV